MIDLSLRSCVLIFHKCSRPTLSEIVFLLKFLDDESCRHFYKRTLKTYQLFLWSLTFWVFRCMCPLNGG